MVDLTEGAVAPGTNSDTSCASVERKLAYLRQSTALDLIMITTGMKSQASKISWTQSKLDEAVAAQSESLEQIKQVGTTLTATRRLLEQAAQSLEESGFLIEGMTPNSGLRSNFLQLGEGARPPDPLASAPGRDAFPGLVHGSTAADADELIRLCRLGLAAYGQDVFESKAPSSVGATSATPLQLLGDQWFSRFDRLQTVGLLTVEELADFLVLVTRGLLVESLYGGSGLSSVPLADRMTPYAISVAVGGRGGPINRAQFVSAFFSQPLPTVDSGLRLSISLAEGTGDTTPRWTPDMRLGAEENAVHLSVFSALRCLAARQCMAAGSEQCADGQKQAAFVWSKWRASDDRVTEALTEEDFENFKDDLQRVCGEFGASFEAITGEKNAFEPTFDHVRAALGARPSSLAARVAANGVGREQFEAVLFEAPLPSTLEDACAPLQAGTPLLAVRQSDAFRPLRPSEEEMTSIVTPAICSVIAADTVCIRKADTECYNAEQLFHRFADVESMGARELRGFMDHALRFLWEKGEHAKSAHTARFQLMTAGAAMAAFGAVEPKLDDWTRFIAENGCLTDASLLQEVQTLTRRLARWPLPAQEEAAAYTDALLQSGLVLGHAFDGDLLDEFKREEAAPVIEAWNRKLDEMNVEIEAANARELSNTIVSAELGDGSKLLADAAHDLVRKSTELRSELRLRRGPRGVRPADALAQRAETLRILQQTLGILDGQHARTRKSLSSEKSFRGTVGVLEHERAESETEIDSARALTNQLKGRILYFREHIASCQLSEATKRAVADIKQIVESALAQSSALRERLGSSSALLKKAHKLLGE